MSNAVKNNLEDYLPEIFHLLGETDLDWERINDLFSRKIDDRVKQSGGQPILIEATLYDIIVEVKKKNLPAIRLIDFFKKLFGELSINLHEDEKRLIKKNVRDALVSLDHKYLNFVGELAVLNNLIKSRTYQLLETESKAGPGKSIDFKLQKVDGQIILVEIQNIHLKEEKIEEGDEKISKFLVDKISQKLESKKAGLSGSLDFYLVPVLWGTANALKIYCNYFKRNKIQIQNVSEPLAYLTLTDETEYFMEHRFGNISNLFKGVEA